MSACRLSCSLLMCIFSSLSLAYECPVTDANVRLLNCNLYRFWTHTTFTVISDSDGTHIFSIMLFVDGIFSIVIINYCVFHSGSLLFIIIVNIIIVVLMTMIGKVVFHPRIALLFIVIVIIIIIVVLMMMMTTIGKVMFHPRVALTCHLPQHPLTPETHFLVIVMMVVIIVVILVMVVRMVMVVMMMVMMVIIVVILVILVGAIQRNRVLFVARDGSLWSW